MTKAQQFIKDNKDNKELVYTLFHSSFNFWESDVVEDVYEVIKEILPNEEKAWQMAVEIKNAFYNHEIDFEYDVRVVIPE